MTRIQETPLPLLFVILIVYLPLQEFFPQVSFAMGINPLNVVMTILLLSVLGSDFQPDMHYLRISRWIKVWMLFTLVGAIWACSSSEPEFLISNWKRYFFIATIFFITCRVVDNRRKCFAAITVVSCTVFIIALEYLSHGFKYRDSNYSHSLRYDGLFGLGGANDIAGFFAINFFWFLFLFNESSGLKKKLAGFGAVVVAAACLFAYSRGAYIGLAAGLLYFGIRKNRSVFAVVTLLLLTVPIWAPEPVKDRLFMLTDQAELDKDTSAQHRLLIWDGAKRLIADHPLVGVGPGNFPRYISDYADLPPHGPRASHNMYLLYASENGILGLLLFLVVLGTLVREGLRLARENDDYRQTWGHCYVSSLLVVVIVNMFGNRLTREEVTGYLWLTAALTVRMRMLAETQCRTGETDGSAVCLVESENP